jgi:hypothetical protein
MEKHHDLIHEFPGYKEKIHDLKVNNAHFKGLFDEYHELDHEIHRIETDTQPASDEVLTDLRKKRVHLKDSLYNLLKQ